MGLFFVGSLSTDGIGSDGMSANSIATFVGWSILPNLITNFIQSFLDKNVRTSLYIPAPKGTSGYVTNRKKVYSAVIVVYLTWTVYYAFQSTWSSNWYSLLGVDQTVDEAGLKTASRALSRKYHPDKAGPLGEEYFIAARHAFESLTDPTRRYAYDRYGPTIDSWKNCITLRDFMQRGVMNGTLYWYAITLGLQLVIAGFRKTDVGAYWRFLAFFLLFTCEMSLIVGPPGSKLAHIICALSPHRTPFQLVALLRELWVTLSLALNQLMPLWVAPTASSVQNDEQINAMVQQALVLGRELEIMAVAACDEQVALVSGGNSQVLKSEMEQYLIDDILSKHPLVRSAWHDSVVTNANQ